MLHNEACNINGNRLPISIDKGLRVIPNDYNGIKSEKDTQFSLADVNPVYSSYKDMLLILQCSELIASRNKSG